GVRAAGARLFVLRGGGVLLLPSRRVAGAPVCRPPMNATRLRLLLFAAFLGLLVAAGARAQSAGDAAGAAPTAAQTRAAERGTMAQRAQSLFGLGIFLLITFAIGQARKPRLK